jgi:hypothetical protein
VEAVAAMVPSPPLSRHKPTWGSFCTTEGLSFSQRHPGTALHNYAIREGTASDEFHGFLSQGSSGGPLLFLFTG